SRGMVKVRCLQFSPLVAMELLRRRAADLGVRIVNRVHITRLLTGDGQYPTCDRVVGAAGFNTRSGRMITAIAEVTILSAGPFVLRGAYPVVNDTGGGYVMGYDVGARLTDMEFAVGGTFTVVQGTYFLPTSYNVAVAHGARLLNARGERFMARYD